MPEPPPRRLRKYATFRHGTVDAFAQAERTTVSNLANMRHEMLKTVANNLRG
jgi:hypothetical protein